MKTTKRIVSLSLAAVIAASCLGTSTFATNSGVNQSEVKNSIVSGLLSKTTKPATQPIGPVPFDTSTEEGKKAQEKFKKLRPTITVEPDSIYGGEYGCYAFTLSCKKVDHAIMYNFYHKGPKDVVYKKLASSFSNEYYYYAYDYYTCFESGKHSFKVEAVSANYNDTIIKTEMSRPATCTLKEYVEENSKDDYSNDIECGEGQESIIDDAEHGESVEYESSEGVEGIVEEAPAMDNSLSMIVPPYYYENTEEYTKSEETGFKSVKNYPLSTFSADVDTASYANLRRLINSNDYITEDAVRVEEMLNYFNYDYAVPTKANQPFAVTKEITDCPWNKDTKLLHIGVQGKDIPSDKLPASNYVFLVDVSGSMYSPDKLDLVKTTIKKLSKTLSGNDRVSIVAYSGYDLTVLEGARGTQVKTISMVMDALESGGCTAGESAINSAYALAEKYYIKGGNNRIILATDGDLNVGISDPEELKEFIAEKRKKDIYLSVLGYGTGNIKDDNMEALADNGDGNYYYIDIEQEAQKVLVEENKGTLYTIADDVKFQVEFNPAQVKGYRLVGYYNRMLNTEDFADDKKDAGDVGVGHNVTAVYEIVPVGSKMKIEGSDLKYQKTESKTASTGSEWATINLRYKNPTEKKSKLISVPVTSNDLTTKMSADSTFRCAVIEFSMILRESEFKGTSSTSDVLDLLDNYDYSKDIYKNEFIGLVKKYVQDYQSNTD